MAFKSIQGSAKQSLLDYFVSGKAVQYHSAEKGFSRDISGLTATGGVISDYTDGSTVYRAHIFTSSGTFSVSAIGDFGSNVEYLVVAGGGGGGYEGGGGAGGFRTNQSGHPLSTGNPSFTVTAGPTSYTVTIGGGAASAVSPAVGGNGTDSYFGPPSTPAGITAKGGGGAGRYNTVNGSPGGSGGGGYSSGGAGGFGYNPLTPAPVLAAVPLPSPYGITQGNNGAPEAGGGGGAGGAGSPGPGGKGGIGSRTDIAGPSYPIGTPGPGGTGGYLAGGGSGAPGSPSPGVSVGPDAGGGGYGYFTGLNNPLVNGLASTGGGGGGGWSGSGNTLQGAGGSGIVVVRYQIAQLTATAKATGGAISYYSGKTIHTFTSSGVFNVTTGPLSVEYVVVAGGASGGIKGGGGGAGGYRTATGFTVNPGPNTVTVGAGGAQAFGVFNSPAPQALGKQGTASVFSTIVSQGGGGGGCDSSNTAGVNGGSGGGAAGGGYGTGTAGLGNRGDGTNQPSATTVPTQGNDGASNVASSPYAGGGGGGAGSAGNSPGPGGTGVQVPTTFQNPASAPGPNGGGLGYPGPSGTYWLAGGGGGGSDVSPTSTGGGPGGPYAGAGNGGAPGPGVSALTNSGSGGGGATPPSSNNTFSGAGGSGIVIIAYPS